MKSSILQKAKTPNVTNKNKEVVGVALRPPLFLVSGLSGKGQLPKGPRLPTL
jgi:hypothetical protein